MADNLTIHLDTADQIATAGGYVLGLREALDADRALTIEEQRRLVAIAYEALLKLSPSEPAVAGTLPDWLEELQGNEEQR